MNKSKSRREIIAREVDREIARWDPKSVDFVELVLKDIQRSEWKEDEAALVVEELIALLSGDLDIDTKIRILCECDKSAGSTWEYIYHSNKPEPQTVHRVLPLDKLPGIFQSQLVPYEWKHRTLLNWDYGVALSSALTALGCDPNQENIFGIARRDLRYGTGYQSGRLVTL